jgi:hypothetical protein
MSRTFFICIVLAFLFSNCQTKVGCSEKSIQPTFIGFNPSDIDTFFLWKFNAGDNFRTRIDTFPVFTGQNAVYTSSGDTTSVLITNNQRNIKAGFDWQIYLPSLQRIISIADIQSEKNSMKCGWGIFSMDKFGCDCNNLVLSFNINSTPYHLIDTMYAPVYAYIHN